MEIVEPRLWLGNVGSWVVSFGRAVEVMGSEIEGKEPIFFFFFLYLFIFITLWVFQRLINLKLAN